MFSKRIELKVRHKVAQGRSCKHGGNAKQPSTQGDASLRKRARGNGEGGKDLNGSYWNAVSKAFATCSPCSR